MASMKTMMMVALDVSPSMSQPVSSFDGTSKLQLAKNFISLFIMQRVLASKTAEFGVATFGNNETSNYLNSSQGGYEGICEVVSMERPSKATFEEIHSIKAGTEQVDLIDAIVVAQDVLMRVNAGKAFNRVMLLITDGENPVEGVDDLEDIVEQMKSIKNFGLYIAMLSKSTPQSSVIKQENAKLLRSLAESTDGRFMEIEELGDSIHLLSGGLGLGTRPTLSKTVLEFTPNLRLPCVFWGKVSKATAPSLKKQQKSEDNEFSEDAIKRDISYRHPDNEDLELSVEERVKGYRYGSQYVPVTPADEDNFKIPGPASIQVIGLIAREKIPRHHFLDGATYLHPTLEAEAAQFCFSALATALLREGKAALARFVKRENSDPSLIAMLPTVDEASGMTAFLLYRVPFVDDVREYNFPSLVAFASEKQVRANPDLTKQRQIMEDFVDCLTIRDFSKSNTTPANPALQNIYSALHGHLLGLDAAEQIAVPDFVSLAKDPARESIVSSVYDFFPLEKVEKKKKRKKVFWSDAAADQQAAEAGSQPGGEAANKKARIELDVSRVTAAITANTSAAAIPKPLPVPLVPKAPPATSSAPLVAPPPTASQSSVAAPSSTTTASSSTAAPTAQADEEEDEDDLGLPEFTVGTPTPVEDCTALVEAIRAKNPPDRKKRIARALEVLAKVIQRNVALGGSRTHYKRAVACLVLFRAVSCEEKDAAAFNAYLAAFKKNYQTGRHALAWQLATDQLLTLIARSEVKSSAVTDDEAEQFLADIDNEGRDQDEDEEEGAV
jgi:hypothetical protein